MKSYLAVFKVNGTEACKDGDVRKFMENLLSTDNFHLSVERIWRDSGRPSIYIIDGSDIGSKLKRFTALR